nr:cupin domain-containing protein [Amycolatopsis sp. FDAARGOS 1241]
MHSKLTIAGEHSNASNPPIDARTSRVLLSMDVLSDAIAVMRTGEPSANRLRAGGAWCYRFAPYAGAGFHVVLRGTGRLIGAGEPVQLGPGDAVLLPHGATHVLSSTPEGKTAVPFETAVDDPAEAHRPALRQVPLRPLARTLPRRRPARRRAPARLRRRAGLGHHVARRRGDRSAPRPGRRRRRAARLLLVYLVRAWFAEHPGAGWPKALPDPEIAAALEALHADPARPWRLEDLAAEVSLSRATLARRFTWLTGRAPMAYLAWWRMVSAARLPTRAQAPSRSHVECGAAQVPFHRARVEHEPGGDLVVGVAVGGQAGDAGFVGGQRAGSRRRRVHGGEEFVVGPDGESVGGQAGERIQRRPQRGPRVDAVVRRDGDRPLPAIAREVGYGPPYAFSHAFKRHFGIAPGRYRVSPAT